MEIYKWDLDEAFKTIKYHFLRLRPHFEAQDTEKIIWNWLWIKDYLKEQIRWEKSKEGEEFNSASKKVPLFWLFGKVYRTSPTNSWPYVFIEG